MFCWCSLRLKLKYMISCTWYPRKSTPLIATYQKTHQCFLSLKQFIYIKSTNRRQILVLKVQLVEDRSAKMSNILTYVNIDPRFLCYTRWSVDWTWALTDVHWCVWSQLMRILVFAWLAQFVRRNVTPWLCPKSRENFQILKGVTPEYMKNFWS